MTIYVDQLMPCISSKKWPYKFSCHMVCDGIEEKDFEALHQFAKDLGLKREWFQNHHVNKALHHYDLNTSKRVQALKMGAQELTRQERYEMIARLTQQYRERRKEESTS